MTSTQFAPQATILHGRFARLEPLGHNHAEDLLAVGREPSIWRYMPSAPFENIAAVKTWIDAALAEQRNGSQIPFATIRLADNRAVGSTRYLTIRREHRGLEIGWTWLATDAQRTPLNTECKLLLLTHAFEALGAMRVEFKTDLRNEISQKALERIGATREGVFRRHMILWDGHIRDSVYYSITDADWPAVKAHLTAKLVS